MKKSNLPEWLLSTPRLILVIMIIALVIFTEQKIGEYSVFKDSLRVVLGYFFGSRGKEESQKNYEKPVETETVGVELSPEEKFISEKFSNDSNNQ